MLRVKRLYIFIIKQFGLLFIGTFFICQFVLMMQFLWRYVDELIGKGLSVTILAQFFWYMGLMLMPQAFPLAILLSSLIAFGNLGESSELTAIKAAGVSLMQTLRPLIAIVAMIACGSLWFQNYVMPEAYKSFSQLLLSMKQKSPELEIPEGIFYDGIPGSNIYVARKDMQTGHLYGIMIYRMTGGYEDAAIILADSGQLQSTAEKKHLLLTLHSGEWFENISSQDMAGAAAVPYRRESFVEKRMVLDFDGGFNMADVEGISMSARSKSMAKLRHDIDSIRQFNDSVAHAYQTEALQTRYNTQPCARKDSAEAAGKVAAGKVNLDTLLARIPSDARRSVYARAASDAEIAASDVELKADYTKYLNRTERSHQMEAISKITLSLSCLIFFFIGAPLGAIIRKGGLGVPVIISVLVFIIYYIFENSGTRMARDNNWTVAFGTLISTAVLAPVAVFFTYKANGDSVVFNIDLYKNFLSRLLGLRQRRHIFRKEVIIEDPDYTADTATLRRLTDEIRAYARDHSLLRLPNPIKVFFRQGDDKSIREIIGQLETVVEDLSNSTDPRIIAYLNHYPIVATHAHTRPFERRWLNALTGIVLPAGIFVYLRMWHFRLRLLRDLRTINNTSDNIIKRIEETQPAATAGPLPSPQPLTPNQPQCSIQ